MVQKFGDPNRRTLTMDVRMDGRVAVITGASTGLGLAMAKGIRRLGRFGGAAARKADALAAARLRCRLPPANRTAGSRPIPATSPRPVPIADTFKKVVADFGKVDIVVTTATSPSSARQGVRHGDRRGLAGRPSTSSCSPPSASAA